MQFILIFLWQYIFKNNMFYAIFSRFGVAFVDNIVIYLYIHTESFPFGVIHIIYLNYIFISNLHTENVQLHILKTFCKTVISLINHQGPCVRNR